MLHEWDLMGERSGLRAFGQARLMQPSRIRFVRVRIGAIVIAFWVLLFSTRLLSQPFVKTAKGYFAGIGDIMCYKGVAANGYSGVLSDAR